MTDQDERELIEPEQVRFDSTSRQHAATDVVELCGRTCERLLGVPLESSGELVIFYLRVEGIWFRGYIDVGVLFLAPAAPDPEDDLEVGGEYLDLGRVLGVEGASIQRFAMCEGVLRVEFEVGEPLVLWEEQGATRWGSAEGEPGPERSDTT